MNKFGLEVLGFTEGRTAVRKLWLLNACQASQTLSKNGIQGYQETKQVSDFRKEWWLRKRILRGIVPVLMTKELLMKHCS